MNLIKLNQNDVAILYYQMLLQQRTLEEQANQTDEIRREIAAHSLSRLEEQTAFLAGIRLGAYLVGGRGGDGNPVEPCGVVFKGNSSADRNKQKNR